MSISQAPARPQSLDPLVGQVINERFRVIGLLAHGGMGRVYVAEQLPLGRKVALKVLSRPQSPESDPEFEKRFLTEASTAAKLRHSNTVTVFDYGRTREGICFIAMELIEGTSLSQAIRAGAPFSPERVMHIAVQIARSLREAHEHDVIHRDLKPANVLLARHDDDPDFVKVLDFGLVKHVDAQEQEGLTRNGLFLGSPKYVAPEQIVGERVDARTDVYSLGVCMYEMLTGRVPFNHDSTVKILMGHMQDTAAPLPGSCPPALAELVGRCLSKDPAKRPASMDDLILALKAVTGADLARSGEHTVSGINVSPRVVPLPTPGAARQSTRPVPMQPAGLIADGSPQQPVAPAVAAGAAGTRKSNLAKGAILVAMILVGAILGLSNTKSKESLSIKGDAPKIQKESTVKVLADPPPAAAVLRAEEAAVGESAHIFVTLTSSPSGAMVLFEGRKYGPTPANIEIDGAAVSRGREITFVFEKSDYEPVRITRIVKLQNLTIDASLSAPSSLADGKARSRSPASVGSVARSAPAVEPAAPALPAVAAAAALPAVPSPVVPAAIVSQPPPPAATAVPSVAMAPALASPQPPRAAPKPANPVAASAPKAAPANPPAAAAAPAVAATPPNVTPSKLVAGAVVPEYPRSARRAGITGIVVARLHVKPDGQVGRVEIVDGPSVFHESVRAALTGRRYAPARLPNGVAVADTHLIRVPFELK